MDDDLNAGQARARILHTLGRDDEARELFDALAATLDGDPCNELLYAHNRGWVELLQVDSTGGPVPRVLLDRAVDLSAPGGSCPSADFYLAARVNRVQATVASGRLEDAETQIRLLREGDATLDADVRAALLELRGRISLERGHAADALEAYSELRARAQASSLPTFSWRAELGRGRALQSQGDLDAASQAYQAAERELDADQQRIPLGEGRETFAGAREASAKRLVDVLERLGEPGRALRAARLARTRALRTLAAFDRVASLDGEARAKWTRGLANYQRLRNDLALHAARAWEVPKSELSGYEETTRERRFALQAALDETLALLDVPAPVLSGPAPGEVFLLYFPTPTGWLGFAQGQKTESHRFDQLPADREGLIRPFERQLLKARQVRVFSYGAVREIDVHALGVRGRPLIAQVPVVYSLDLGRAPLDDSPRRRALVVADPAQDLSAARREGRDSARWLARFFPTSILEARAATRDAVIRGFTPDLSVWHFAGHGELEGRGGWLSALWLTEGQKLEVSDILTLPQVPVHVVLSGCETAREAGDSPVAAIGIAQAFVIRGASAVFATNRQVSDESGRAFSAALYAEGERPVFDARHFQRAILRVPAAGHGDWSAYRMLVP